MTQLILHRPMIKLPRGVVYHLPLSVNRAFCTTAEGLLSQHTNTSDLNVKMLKLPSELELCYSKPNTG